MTLIDVDATCINAMCPLWSDYDNMYSKYKISSDCLTRFSFFEGMYDFENSMTENLILLNSIISNY